MGSAIPIIYRARDGERKEEKEKGIVNVQVWRERERERESQSQSAKDKETEKHRKLTERTVRIPHSMNDVWRSDLEQGAKKHITHTHTHTHTHSYDIHTTQHSYNTHTTTTHDTHFLRFNMTVGSIFSFFSAGCRAWFNCRSS